MALIKCPKCGKEISDKAENCSNCGYLLLSTKKKKINKRRVVGIVIIAILIFVNLVGNAGVEAIPPSIIFGIIGLYLIIKKPKIKKNNETQDEEQSKKVKPKKKTSEKVLLVVLLCIFVIGFVFMLKISTINTIQTQIEIITTQSKELKEDTVSYTDLELINLEGHPKVFDPFYQAAGFYSAIGSDKVRILNTFKEGGAYNQTHEEDYFIYMDNGASRVNYIDEITINFRHSDLCQDMVLDDVVKIAVSYMPMNIFNDYYDFKRAFIYSYNNTKSYHYAWKINNKGIEYHNNGHPQLWRSYGFFIIHNENTNEFTIRINSWAEDVRMIGGHSSEWFDEYTEPWSIDLNNYIE